MSPQSKIQSNLRRHRIAHQGKIKQFTGVNDPYEEPEHQELILDTDKETVEESVEKVLEKLVNLGYITR